MVRAMITQCLEPGRKNSLETKDWRGFILFCFIFYHPPPFLVNSMLKNLHFILYPVKRNADFIR